MCEKLLVSLCIVGLAGFVLVVPAAASDYIDTTLEACEELISEVPEGFDIDPKDVKDLLHGVWLGTRIAWENDLIDQPGDYMMIVDVENRESMTYELRGGGIPENRFFKEFPPALRGAPKLTYLSCGGSGFGPFRDQFVKVSNRPAEGLQALGALTGVTIDGSSIFDALVAFRKADQYSKQGASVMNTSFYTLGLTSIGGTGGRVHDNIRLDLVGQMIAAAGTSRDGRPKAGHEGGFFHGVRTDGGNYLASFAVDAYADPELATLVGDNGGVYVLCTAVTALTAKEDSGDDDPLHDFAYTKVVLGPLQ